MPHRLAPEAAADLDDIWYYIAKESGSTAIADRLIDAVARRFLLLAEHSRPGRSRDELRPGLGSFGVARYVIIYRIDGPDVLVLRVLHGSRDIAAIV